MSDRPTPETDTLESRLSAFNFYDRYYKTLTLARSLERERDEAREQVRQLQAWKDEKILDDSQRDAQPF